MNFSLVEVAYNLAQKEYQQKQFSFKDLYAKVTHSMRWNNAEANKYIGELYTDMMQDKRFTFCGNNTWCLSEYLNLKQKGELNSKLYENTNAQVYEEGYEAPTSTPADAGEYELEEEVGVEEFIDNGDEAEESYQDYESMLKNQNADDDEYEDDGGVYSNE